MPTADCSLELNQAEWHRQDGALRELRSGDFLRLAIQGPSTMTVEGLRLALCDHELAEAQRYIYTILPPCNHRVQHHGSKKVEKAKLNTHLMHRRTDTMRPMPCSDILTVDANMK